MIMLLQNYSVQEYCPRLHANSKYHSFRLSNLLDSYDCHMGHSVMVHCFRRLCSLR